MRKPKIVSSLARTSMITSIYLTQTAKELSMLCDVSEMTIFSNTSLEKIVYLDGKPIKPFAGAVSGKYIPISLLELLSYKIKVTEMSTICGAQNILTIDNIMLKAELNGIRITLDLIQLSGIVYIKDTDFTSLTGATVELKDNCCWLNSPAKHFILKTDNNFVKVYDYTVSNKELLVPLFVIEVALPFLERSKESYKDTNTGRLVDLSQFERNGKYPLVKVITFTGGTFSLTKEGDEYIFTSKHKGYAIRQKSKDESDFLKKIVSAPVPETGDLSDDFVHEVNVYRNAAGKKSVISGSYGSKKGLIKSVFTSYKVPKLVRLLMLELPNRELFMGEINSIYVRCLDSFISIEVYD